MSLAVVKNEVGRVLRDNKDLRSVDKREKVWLLVKQTLPTAKFSTVERCIRHFQNTKGLFLPKVDDERYIIENRYYNYFSKDSKNKGIYT